MSDDLTAIGQQILASQPFSQLLKAQIREFRQGYAELWLAISPELTQQFGFVHGGVLSYAADNALTFAGGSVLGMQVVTAEYKINYVKPAQGHELIAKASVLSSGSRQAVCHCLVYCRDDQGEYLVAIAQGTIMTLSSKR
ncbi:PaaI family thioesterase [Herpetosiphon llansteffanensis]|uniref:PaaI family thioesterase n=1 Tax=Herpetosiphon llansteffanensis TaxID=2094568 RepID=UPI000D7C983B|nr:PaaI family thioesterase [Herpetosiphon llansteffanensis]